MNETCRYTIDMPKEQHVFLKMLAEMSGISLKEIVMNHLPAPQVEFREELQSQGWGELIENTMIELDPLLQRLADR